MGLGAPHSRDRLGTFQEAFYSWHPSPSVPLVAPWFRAQLGEVFHNANGFLLKMLL